MRAHMIGSILILALICWSGWARGQTPPVLEGRILIVIPTALQQLDELRMNTGDRAVLKDGTMSAVYVVETPSQGNIYLNFHLDIASESGPAVLYMQEFRLEGSAAPQAAYSSSHQAPATPAIASYAPFDWFMDTGSAEIRGDSVTIRDKAILQFTIEVPQQGLDDLTLFVRSQRIGTIREIRERIAIEGNHP